MRLAVVFGGDALLGDLAVMRAEVFDNAIVEPDGRSRPTRLTHLLRQHQPAVRIPRHRSIRQKWTTREIPVVVLERAG